MAIQIYNSNSFAIGILEMVGIRGAIFIPLKMVFTTTFCMADLEIEMKKEPTDAIKIEHIRIHARISNTSGLRLQL